MRDRDIYHLANPESLLPVLEKLRTNSPADPKTSSRKSVGVRWAYGESLLNVLEKLLTNSPAAPKTSSGKSEGVRWACGLIKNLAKSEDNAAFIGQKRILQRWDRRLDRKPSSPSNSGTETQPSDLIE